MPGDDSGKECHRGDGEQESNEKSELASIGFENSKKLNQNVFCGTNAL
jgi:hypothetical protein